MYIYAHVCMYTYMYMQINVYIYQYIYLVRASPAVEQDFNSFHVISRYSLNQRRI